METPRPDIYPEIPPLPEEDAEPQPLSQPDPEKWIPILDKVITTQVEASQPQNDPERILPPATVQERFRRVVEAAKLGEAIEKENERRQEIKDESTTAAMGKGMTKVGAILTQGNYTPVSSQPVSTDTSFAVSRGTTLASIRHGVYRKPMQIGFLTALVVLAAAVLYVLVQ